MVELEFHPALYDGSAVRDAAALFADHGAFVVEERGASLVVRGQVHDPDLAAELPLALAQHALAGTIERRRASAEQP